MIHLSNDTGDLFAQTYNFAEKQVRKLVEKHPQLYPLHTQNGIWAHEGPAWTHWGDGFLPGLMWIFTKHSGPESAERAYWMEHAIRYTTPLEPRKHDHDVHDLGFLFLSTYYRWWRLTQDPAHREVLIEAGKTLALRFTDLDWPGSHARLNLRFEDIPGLGGPRQAFFRSLENDEIIIRRNGPKRLKDLSTYWRVAP